MGEAACSKRCSLNPKEAREESRVARVDEQAFRWPFNWLKTLEKMLDQILNRLARMLLIANVCLLIDEVRKG